MALLELSSMSIIFSFLHSTYQSLSVFRENHLVQSASSLILQLHAFYYIAHPLGVVFFL